MIRIGKYRKRTEVVTDERLDLKLESLGLRSLITTQQHIGELNFVDKN